MMNEDEAEEKLNVMKQVSMDQKELDAMVEGFQIGDLRRLMGPKASSCTVGLEELYGKMLAKINSLARSVEKSSAKVLELVSFYFSMKKLSVRLFAFSQRID